jgi:hypothetical protein
MPAQPFSQSIAALSDAERAVLRQFVVEFQQVLAPLIFASEYFDEATLATTAATRARLLAFIVDCGATRDRLCGCIDATEPYWDNPTRYPQLARFFSTNNHAWLSQLSIMVGYVEILSDPIMDDEQDLILGHQRLYAAVQHLVTASMTLAQALDLTDG